ncbi:hypothetical protein TNCV_368581 [Trichonephila clavipes]|nr:hypothetical protein TNCV_368581 [Trichonephila clavipes]
MDWNLVSSQFSVSGCCCQSLRQVGLRYDTVDGDATYLRNLGVELEGREIYSPALVGFAVIAHKTFSPIDFTSTYSAFGGIGSRTLALRSGVRCSNHQAAHNPDVLGTLRNKKIMLCKM